jgi:hypothetical protein
LLNQNLLEADERQNRHAPSAWAFSITKRTDGLPDSRSFAATAGPSVGR